MNDYKIQTDKIRKEIFLAAYVGGVGHLASSFSSVEILYSLYLRGVMNVDSSNPHMESRDRLILSKGHASLALYAVLSKAGFFQKDELMTFARPGSRLGGEPHGIDIPGVEASTGSLGHGLSIGLGMALANKLDNQKGRVYVILGDGECQEGSIWEGVMSASKFKLDNLTVILDCNRIQKMGFIKDIMGTENWRESWESFGWQVDNVDGHDIDALTDCLKIEPKKDKPRLIIANTIKGKGVSIIENEPSWHFKMPSKKELKVIKQELNITDEELEQCRKHI